MALPMKSERKLSQAAVVVLCLVTGLCASGNCAAQALSASGSPTVIRTADLRTEVNDFLDKELAVHLGAINNLQSPPERVLGIPTTGEFSWGTFMRSLAAYAQASRAKPHRVVRR